MSFKRPYVPTWGRQRTQAEIELDERLEAAAKSLAAPAVSKTEWARAQYRAASRAGLTKAAIEARYNYGDVRIMDEHVDQMFWQMVRHQLRTNPTFNMQLEFIESFYELPQHEFLNRIKSRYWAQMQKWTDDRQHSAFGRRCFERIVLRRSRSRTWTRRTTNVGRIRRGWRPTPVASPLVSGESGSRMRFNRSCGKLWTLTRRAAAKGTTNVVHN